MAQTQDDTVQVRISKEQRELLRLLKSSGESYTDALDALIEQEPEEYSALVDFAEQKV